MNIREINESVYDDFVYDVLVNVEESGDPKEYAYIDSVGHVTIGIGFDITNRGNLEAVLNAMGVNTSEGTHGGNLLDSIRDIIPNDASQSSIQQIQKQQNQAWQEYDMALNGTDSSTIEFRFENEDQIRDAFDAFVESREARLNQFFTHYNISAIDDSYERAALLSFLYNSKVHTSGPNEGWPTTLTSSSREGGNLDIDIFTSGAGLDQILSMYNWWQRVSSEPGSSIHQYSLGAGTYLSEDTVILYGRPVTRFQPPIYEAA